ncbi:toprim domain-containing protein [bacterium]|nr:toprim domain-containing protein [bacterium]
MEFDSITEAGEYIKNYYELDSLFDKFLEADRTRHGHACPICGHGTRTHKEGLLRVPNSSPALYHCFCCDFTGDAFDLLQKAENINYTESVKKFAEWVNFDFTIKKQGEPMTITVTTQKATVDTKPKTESVKTDDIIKIDDKQDETEEQKKKDNIEIMIKAKKAFNENPNNRAMDYMSKRGFTFETCKKEQIGYDREKDQVIIPTCKDDYIYHDIEGTNRGNGKGKQSFWHYSILEDIISNNILYKELLGNKLFICEAWADGLSLSQNGFQAVALNSTGKSKEFIKFIKNHKSYFEGFEFLLNLDNDEAGKEATEFLKTELKAMGLTFFNVTFCLFRKYIDVVKDTNELLIKDSEYLKIKADEIYKNPALALYIDRKNAENKFKEILKSYEQPQKESISTGFKILDDILDGGFNEGLYILGAVSSLGKTSFALQVASSIAENGKDILIFSLEMSSKELLAKIISRLTFESHSKFARSTKEILNNWTFKKRNTDEKTKEDLEFQELVLYHRKKAFERLQKFLDKIYISEGIGEININNIREQIEEHIKITGNTPFVLIDYLQIIAPLDVRMTDKQIIDRNITELKRISRDFNCVVFGISSFNRESYKEEVNLTSFKESGSIEYGSDVLIGIQYKALEREEKENPKTGDIECESDAQYKKRKTKFYKDLEDMRHEGKFIPLQVKILKNRNGKTGNADIYFKPPYNYFTDEPIKAIE